MCGAQVHCVQSEAGILVTTYDQLRLQRADVLSVKWGYVVLDEGHKIRAGWCMGNAFCLQLAFAGSGRVFRFAVRGCQ